MGNQNHYLPWEEKIRIVYAFIHPTRQYITTFTFNKIHLRGRGRGVSMIYDQCNQGKIRAAGWSESPRLAWSAHLRICVLVSYVCFCVSLGCQLLFLSVSHGASAGSLLPPEHLPPVSSATPGALWTVTPLHVMTLPHRRRQTSLLLRGCGQEPRSRGPWPKIIGLAYMTKLIIFDNMISYRVFIL